MLLGPPDKKFEQVGNAVCARLASAIGTAFMIGAMMYACLRLIDLSLIAGKAFLIGIMDQETPAMHTLVEIEKPPAADDGNYNNHERRHNVIDT